MNKVAAIYSVVQERANKFSYFVHIFCLFSSSTLLIYIEEPRVSKFLVAVVRSAGVFTLYESSCMGILI